VTSGSHSRSLVPAIAQAWGTSRAYVYKLITRGCPVDSLESATEWRNANAKLGVGYRSGHSRPESFQADPENPENQGAGVENRTNQQPGFGGYRRKRLRLNTIEKALKQAIEVEEQAAEVVQECQGGKHADKLVTAINAYNKASANRIEMEESVLELQKKRGELISVEQAKDIIRRAWGPLLTRLRAVGKRCASKANPVEDVMAERVISEEIESAILEGQASYQKALSNGPPASE
jgi:NADH dehydrogenase/NADH:ubiquinone oxidoreductase subunit G